MDTVLRAGANNLPVNASADFSSTDDWSYVASSGGITNTTPVTLCAAPTNIATVQPQPYEVPQQRVVLTRLDVLNSHATVDTEVSILDGSTVIWLRKMKAGNVQGSVYSCGFSPPLRASPGNALTAVCGTTGSQIYINAGGRII